MLIIHGVLAITNREYKRFSLSLYKNSLAGCGGGAEKAVVAKHEGDELRKSRTSARTTEEISKKGTHIVCVNK